MSTGRHRGHHRAWTVAVAGVVAAATAGGAVPGAAPSAAVAGEASTAAAGTNVRVSPPDAADDQQPSLAVDPRRADHLAIAYQALQDGGEQRSCALAVSSDGGTHWDASVLYGPSARAAVPEGFAACWNPSVAYGPDGALYYAFQTSLLPGNPYSQVLIAVSHDGGAGFDAARLVDPASPAPGGGRAGGDWWPSLAVDQHRNRVYVTWSRFTPDVDSSQVLSAVSADGARSFAAPVTVSPGDQLDVTGSTVAVATDGSAYIIWTDYTQWERGDLERCGTAGCSPYGFTVDQMKRALHTLYADEGVRLDFTQDLGCEAFRTPAMEQLGLDGRGLNRGGNCTLPAALQSAQSSDGGQSWQVRSPPANAVYLGCYVEYEDEMPPWPQHACDATHYSSYDHNVARSAVDPASGTILTAWWNTGGYDLNGASRVAVSMSRDGGSTWAASSPVCLRESAVGDQQHRPAVATAPGGRVDVVCYDLRSDGRQDVYWTSASKPGGAFSAPLRVSAVPGRTDAGPLSDDGWHSFGDHIAVASTNQQVDIAWTDARGAASHQAIEFAALPAPSTTAPGGTAGGVPWVAGVAAGAAALVVAAGIPAVRRRRARTAGG